MKFLTYEKKGSIGTLAVNREGVLNALNGAVLEELKEFFDFKVVDEELKVLIFTGNGEKAFIAGADIKEMNEMRADQIQDFLELGQGVTHQIQNSHFITIAAVNGYALGGGLEMALACDFIYAAPHAKLGLPEITFGIIPGFGGTQRLARAVGTRRAKELIATGKILTAQEAEQIGLVNHVSAPGKLLEDCFKTAGKISEHSIVALQQGKNAINYGYSLGIHEALEIELNMFTVCFRTKDREEAMGAFLEKSRK